MDWEQNSYQELDVRTAANVILVIADQAGLIHAGSYKYNCE